MQREIGMNRENMNKNTVNLLSKAKQSYNYILNNYFKFLFQKYFLNLVKSFLTLIKFNFDSLSRKIKISCLVINKFKFFTQRRIFV